MGRKLKILPEILVYPNWRHRVYLGNGLCAMGYNTLENDWDFYGMPADMKGKTLLDLGANDGYYSFKAEQKGASEVTAMDIYWGDGSTMVGGWPLEGITLLKTYFKSDVVIRPDSVYNLHKYQQQWDVVFCNDLLSWLEDIPGALGEISTACKEKLIIHDTFSTDKKAPDIQIRHIGIAKLHRMQLDYLIRQLRAKGFNKISIKKIYSFKHYTWQFENFLPANSDKPVEVWDSPINGNVIKKENVNAVWVLQQYKEFVYLRDLGWVKKSDLHIKKRTTAFWIKQFKKCIPDWVMARWYGRMGEEKHSGEFVITAER
jgi:tRNA (mo5U34)-methyltransferase